MEGVQLNFYIISINRITKLGKQEQLLSEKYWGSTRGNGKEKQLIIFVIKCTMSFNTLNFKSGETYLASI